MSRVISQKFETRNEIWRAIRSSGEFTFRQLHHQCHLSERSVSLYLNGLVAAGFVEKIEGKKAIVYRLIKENGIQAPNIDVNGNKQTVSAYQKMWIAIKILKFFDCRDLAFAADSKENIAKNFCAHLKAAGYLKAAGKSRFTLVPSRNSGPICPVFKRDKHGGKKVYDPNLGKVVWTKEERQ